MFLSLSLALDVHASNRLVYATKKRLFAYLKISTLQQAPTAQRLRADRMSSCDDYYSHHVLNHLLKRPFYLTKFRVYGPGRFARQVIE